jgi:hypothetical protein
LSDACRGGRADDGRRAAQRHGIGLLIPYADPSLLKRDVTGIGVNSQNECHRIHAINFKNECVAVMLSASDLAST